MADTLQRVASPRQQLGAVLRKNLLLKRRALKTSCCEVLSPCLFLGILVLGYYLSSTDYYAAGIYAALNLKLAPLVDVSMPTTAPSRPAPLDRPPACGAAQAIAPILNAQAGGLDEAAFDVSTQLAAECAFDPEAAACANYTQVCV